MIKNKGHRITLSEPELVTKTITSFYERNFLNMILMNDSNLNIYSNGSNGTVWKKQVIVSLFRRKKSCIYSEVLQAKVYLIHLNVMFSSEDNYALSTSIVWNG